MMKLARAVWRSPVVPLPLRRMATPIVSAAVLRHLLSAGLPRDSDAVGDLVVSGFLSAHSGIGRAGRLTVQALRAAGAGVVEHDLDPFLSQTRLGRGRLPGDAGCGVWLLHCNAPEAIIALSRMPREAAGRYYRVGYWAWELPTAPRAWIETTRLFDEIWAPSQYVADALAGADAPVRVMPHCVPAPNAARSDRARFGLSPDVAYALAMADLRSSAARKNPLGAVEAYLRAYPQPSAGAGLIVKLSHTDFDATAFRRLEDVARVRPDVQVFTEALSDDEVADLIASADVLMSLHRAEGFGLPLAEALAQGKPVLATGWSGNLEFMAGLEDMLVPAALVPVRDPSGVYRAPRDVWAEPDLDAAAAKLRALLDDAERRAALGAQGKAAVSALAEAWSPAALAAAPFARHILDHAIARSA